MWPALLRDLPMVMWRAARSLALPPFLTSDSIPSFHPVDLTLLATPLPRQWISPQLLASVGVKIFSVLSLFIPLPPPLYGLNPLSVPAGPLNYSVEHCCSPQRAISETERGRKADRQWDGSVGGWLSDGSRCLSGSFQGNPILIFLILLYLQSGSLNRIARVYN